MPLYLYQCSACAERFEELVFGSEAVACPSCAAGEPERLPSRASVGGAARAERAEPMAGPCGSCGDPRGPGACDL